uniref:Uncharacterized protein n=1 Tax=Anguilla anguilla TaxID=7936 RepID=A0A0E9U3H3_ANGAN
MFVPYIITLSCSLLVLPCLVIYYVTKPAVCTVLDYCIFRV